MAKSPAWQVCLATLDSHKNRALEKSIHLAEKGENNSYYLGQYEIINRVIMSLPELVIDYLTEREDNDG